MYILESRSDRFLPIILHIPFDALNPFRHYLLISYMLLPDVGIWCNRALCVETAHSTYFTATPPLVSVLLCHPYILTILSSCMLLLHPVLTSANAGSDLCTLCPDLCTLHPDL